MMTANVREKVNSLPKSPGVYLYKDIKGEIIYVGKANNLRNRVKSYFQDIFGVETKTYALAQRVNDIKYIEAFSELEALILEAELIKKYHPKYNINLKDDKSYIYIVIRPEKVIISGKKYTLPRIFNLRKSDLIKGDLSFGPYPDSTAARYVIRALRKIIPYRDCSMNKFERYAHLHKPCLYGYIGLCSAPCTESISPKEYGKDINKIKKILLGGTTGVLRTLNLRMEKASREMEFEKAALYRNILTKFEYVRQDFIAAENYMGNPYLVDDLALGSLKSLMENIPIIKVLPRRIECYDISNISGKDAVASMVVATDGRIDKNEYRRFRMQGSNKPDDFGMIRETIRRRIKNNWLLPDLMIIDGGKGQISSVWDVLNEENINIPVIGITKRFETLVYRFDDEFKEVVLPRENEGLKLIQRLRDEAHRFAQKYHHLLRLKSITV